MENFQLRRQYASFDSLHLNHFCRLNWSHNPLSSVVDCQLKFGYARRIARKYFCILRIFGAFSWMSVTGGTISATDISNLCILLLIKQEIMAILVGVCSLLCCLAFEVDWWELWIRNSLFGSCALYLITMLANLFGFVSLTGAFFVLSILRLFELLLNILILVDTNTAGI